MADEVIIMKTVLFSILYVINPVHIKNRNILMEISICHKL